MLSSPASQEVPQRRFCCGRDMVSAAEGWKEREGTQETEEVTCLPVLHILETADFCQPYNSMLKQLTLDRTMELFGMLSVVMGERNALFKFLSLYVVLNLRDAGC